eukprot:COSAG05_NODE_9663_length_609_cov_0.868627_2_plen_25_part_01
MHGRLRTFSGNHTESVLHYYYSYYT